MLIVVEGPTAVGKTTWLRALPPEQVVAEEWEALGIPRGGGPADPDGVEAQAFWVAANSRRWSLALEAERQHGLACVDTNPLKLYYNFALVAEGLMDRVVFEAGFQHTRAAMAEGRLGFADHIVLLTASPAALAARKAGDPNRSRRHFASNVRLGPALQAYHATLEELRPGTVRVFETENSPLPAAESLLSQLEPPRWPRSDLATLDRLKQRLDRILAS